MKKMYKILAAIILCVSLTAAPAASDDLLSSGTIAPREDIPARTDTLLYAEERNDRPSSAIDEAEEDYDYMEEDYDYLEEEDELDLISDPLESINRISFQFNDKLYFWIFKPISKVYGAIIPEGVRLSVKNVFNNISTPIRLVNNVLQLKMKNAGDELLRFGINTTYGMFGIYDVAKTEMGISLHDEDFGQTLGVWGAGPGIYLNWPFFGPSSVRDTAGFVGDLFLDPLAYVFEAPSIERYVIRAAEYINNVSLSKGEYEEIKKDALDPYDAVKDIYFQYRKSKVDR